MKKIVLFGSLIPIFFIAGCMTNHNFMDVDNPNAKEDLIDLIGSGNIPKVNTKDIIPGSLSGTRNDVKGYAEKYYTGKVEEYVDKAKEGLSGATQTLKGFYNDSVDELNGVITDKVNGTISGELNKFKIK